MEWIWNPTHQESVGIKGEKKQNIFWKMQLVRIDMVVVTWVSEQLRVRKSKKNDNIGENSRIPYCRCKFIDYASKY